MTNSPTSLNAFDYLKLDDLEQIVLTEAQRRHDTKRIAYVYPDEGPLRRELYPKHIAFFKAGATHMERAAIAANRVGKTWGIGGYETALHLTEAPARAFVDQGVDQVTQRASTFHVN